MPLRIYDKKCEGLKNVNMDVAIKQYENSYIIPNGQCLFAFDNSGNFITNTGKRRVGKLEYTKVDNIDVNSMTFEYCAEEVVYIGLLRGHWGHFLVDSTVRMWALLDDICKGKKILANIEGMEPFYREWFKLFGIDIDTDIISPQLPIKYKKLLVPDISYFPGKYVTDKYIVPFDYVRDKICNDNAERWPVYDKIYLSRAKFSVGTKQLGEDFIQGIFEDNGYKVLFPEEIPFKEQIWYYAHCNSIVTTTGTIAHNILFCNPGTELVLLNRYDDMPVHQGYINKCRKAEVTVINAYSAGSTHDKNLMILTPELENFFDKRAYKYERKNRINMLILKLLFYIPKAYKLYWKKR